MRGDRARWLLAALTLAAAGCQSPPTNSHDPRARLDELLAEWRRVQANGWTCEQRAPEGTPLVDCERIRKGVQRVALEFPRDSRTLLANAVLSFEADRPEEAQMYLDALFEIEPVHPDAAVLRGRIAMREGNLRFARRLLREQIELSPAHAELRETLAAALYLGGELDGARKELRAAERLGAPVWRVAYHRGLVAEAAGDPGAAAAHYTRALDARPDWPRAVARLRGLDLSDPTATGLEPKTPTPN